MTYSFSPISFVFQSSFSYAYMFSNQSSTYNQPMALPLRIYIIPNTPIEVGGIPTRLLIIVKPVT